MLDIWLSRHLYQRHLEELERKHRHIHHQMLMPRRPGLAARLARRIKNPAARPHRPRPAH